MSTAIELPLVTVGIPTFNRPIGLQKTLDCILNQTYLNLNILISDNSSTDPQVIEILEKYKKNDVRINYVVQNKNISLVPNFQFLLDNAIGDYFFWAADDDDWDLNFIETCVTALEKNKDVVLCISDIILEAEDGTKKKGNLNRGFMQKNMYVRCFNFVKSNIENKFFLCGIYRLSVLKGVVFPNNWGGEHMFLLEVITKGKFLYLPNKSNFYYFLGGNSKSKASIKKAFNIKRKFAFLDAYPLRFAITQFRFKGLNFFQKIVLFFFNSAGLILNEDTILYYNLIKKPIKEWRNKRKD